MQESNVCQLFTPIVLLSLKGMQQPLKKELKVNKVAVDLRSGIKWRMDRVPRSHEILMFVCNEVGKSREILMFVCLQKDARQYSHIK